MSEDWTASPDGGWAGNIHPAAWFNGRTYFAYADGDGNIEIRVEEAGVVSAPTVLLSGQASDPHDGPSVLVRPDGHVVWALVPHNGDTMYVGVSDDPEDISAFTVSTFSVDHASYADLHQSTAGTLYLIYRDSGALGAHIAMAKSANGGATWGAPVILFRDVGEYPYWFSECDGSRLDIATSDGDSGIYHFYLDLTDDSRHQTDGTLITAGLPLAPSDITLIHSASPSLVRQPYAVWCDGPAVLWATRTVAGTTPGDYLLAEWDGDSWVVTTIATTGAAVSSHFSEGGLCFFSRDIIYLSRYEDGAWNMRWSTRPWATSTLAGGGDGPEIHPVKVRSTNVIAWMNGDVLPSPDYDIMAGIRVDRGRFMPAPFGTEVGFAAGITFAPSGPVMLLPHRFGTEVGFAPGLRLTVGGARQVMLTGGGIETPEMTEGGTEGQVLTFHEGSVPAWEDGGGPGGGDITTDAAWAAAGDLIVGSGADTATILSAGDEGDVLTIASGVPAWAPPAPAAGIGAILIADDHAVPLVFGDLLQTEEGDDLLYADPG